MPLNNCPLAFSFKHREIALSRKRGVVILSWTLILVCPSKMSKEKIREIYEFFFKTADADGDGMVSGPDAANMFRKSGISDEALRNVRYNST